MPKASCLLIASGETAATALRGAEAAAHGSDGAPGAGEGGGTTACSGCCGVRVASVLPAQGWLQLQLQIVVWGVSGRGGRPRRQDAQERGAQADLSHAMYANHAKKVTSGGFVLGIPSKCTGLLHARSRLESYVLGHWSRSGP